MKHIMDRAFMEGVFIIASGLLIMATVFMDKGFMAAAYMGLDLIAGIYMEDLGAYMAGVYMGWVCCTV